MFERGIAAFQVVDAVVLHAVAQRQILRPRRRADRIGLHEAQLLQRSAERGRCEKTARDGVPSQVIKRDGHFRIDARDQFLLHMRRSETGRVRRPAATVQDQKPTESQTRLLRSYEDELTLLPLQRVKQTLVYLGRWARFPGRQLREVFGKDLFRVNDVLRVATDLLVKPAQVCGVVQARWVAQFSFCGWELAACDL